MVNSDRIKQALLADLTIDAVTQDVTTQLLETVAQEPCRAIIKAREAGIFSGSVVLQELASLLGNKVQVEAKAQESEPIHVGMEIAVLRGPIGICLSLERTILNFLGHLCGVATSTRQFVDLVKGRPIKVLATRKTLPGLRELELQAVVAGGGCIHRRSLSDGILIKDNHIQMSDEWTLLDNAERMRSPLHRVEIEVQSLEQLEKVLHKNPDVVMLDNLSLADMQKGIQLIRQKNPSPKIEVSGGINLDLLRKYAELDIDYVSIGRMTHSAPWLNLTMDFER